MEKKITIPDITKKFKTLHGGFIDKFDFSVIQQFDVDGLDQSFNLSIFLNDFYKKYLDDLIELIHDEDNFTILQNNFNLGEDENKDMNTLKTLRKYNIENYLKNNLIKLIDVVDDDDDDRINQLIFDVDYSHDLDFYSSNLLQTNEYEDEVIEDLIYLLLQDFQDPINKHLLLLLIIYFLLINLKNDIDIQGEDIQPEDEQVDEFIQIISDIYKKYKQNEDVEDDKLSKFENIASQFYKYENLTVNKLVYFTFYYLENNKESEELALLKNNIINPNNIYDLGEFEYKDFNNFILFFMTELADFLLKFNFDSDYLFNVNKLCLEIIKLKLSYKGLDKTNFKSAMMTLYSYVYLSCFSFYYFEQNLESIDNDKLFEINFNFENHEERISVVNHFDESYLKFLNYIYFMACLKKNNFTLKYYEIETDDNLENIYIFSSEENTIVKLAEFLNLIHSETKEPNAKDEDYLDIYNQNKETPSQLNQENYYIDLLNKLNEKLNYENFYNSNIIYSNDYTAELFKKLFYILNVFLDTTHPDSYFNQDNIQCEFKLKYLENKLLSIILSLS